MNLSVNVVMVLAGLLRGRRTTMNRAISLLIALCCALAISPQRAGAQSSPVPQWQIAAGGSMLFEVASVRPTDTFTPPSFPLSSDNSYRPTGGLLTASFPLITYIQFAYKLSLTADQRQTLL